MKIIAGELKNRKFKSRKGSETRPTTSFLKEAFFNLIGERVQNSIFLDLFSGTGAITFEALSRGSKRAVLIEKNQEALKLIIENINYLGLESKSRAYKNISSRAIEILYKKNEKFNIIFLDPPYEDRICEQIVKLLSENLILADKGIICCEHLRKEKLPDIIGKFVKFDERTYGHKTLTFYEKNMEEC